MLHALVHDFISPILRRPPRLQVAALCHRGKGDATEILLLTSRETRRWVLPKGWPKRGLDAANTAREEAWEEAGVRFRDQTSVPVGTYSYLKRLDGGLPVPVAVSVFASEVADLAEDYPELGQRDRRWMRPAEAALAVEEDELRGLLRNFRAPTAAPPRG